MAEQLDVTFESLNEQNLGALKLMNSVIFPIKYQEKIYQDCMLFEDMTQLAYHDGVLVGAVAARCEMQANGRARMYIAMLGVLAPYRGCRIGSRLLKRSLAAAMEDPIIEEAYLHVQVGNDEAIDFYKRYGFEERETIEQYYKRLVPPHAVVLAKTLTGAPPA